MTAVAALGRSGADRGANQAQNRLLSTGIHRHVRQGTLESNYLAATACRGRPSGVRGKAKKDTIFFDTYLTQRNSKQFPGNLGRSMQMDLRYIGTHLDFFQFTSPFF